jgi:hypothetical protein
VEDWTATKQATGTWLFTWDGASNESFDIWLDGELLDTVTGGEYECAESGYDAQPPHLEIVDDDSATYAENDLYPPYAILQWRMVTGADGYLVEEYLGGNWIRRKEVSESGAGYYWYKTRVLEDDTTYQFRVVAVDLNDNPGTPVSFDILLARNPSPPDVTYDIDGSNNLVVEAA